MELLPGSAIRDSQSVQGKWPQPVGAWACPAQKPFIVAHQGGTSPRPYGFPPEDVDLNQEVSQRKLEKQPPHLFKKCSYFLHRAVLHAKNNRVVVQGGEIDVMTVFYRALERCRRGRGQ